MFWMADVLKVAWEKGSGRLEEKLHGTHKTFLRVQLKKKLNYSSMGYTSWENTGLANTRSNRHEPRSTRY